MNNKLPSYIDRISTTYKNKFIALTLIISSLSIFSFGWLFGVHNLKSTKYIVDIWAVLSSIGSLLAGTGTVAAAYVAWLAYNNWLNPLKVPKERECDIEFYKAFMDFHKQHIHPFSEIDSLEMNIFQEVRNHDEYSHWSMNDYQDFWQQQKEALSKEKYLTISDVIDARKMLLKPLDALPREDSALIDKTTRYLFAIEQVHRSFHGLVSVEKVQEATKHAECQKSTIMMNGHMLNIRVKEILPGGELRKKVEQSHKDIVQILKERLGYDN